MMTNKKLGIYVHIPYCLRKCPYCGFYSVPVNEDFSEDRYVQSLLEQIEEYGKTYAEGRDVDSIFFGGGTPTVLRADSLITILEAIKRAFSVSLDCEISIESNPGISRAKECAATSYYRDLVAGGFNRLSIGIQSFDDDVLKTLGRVHDSAEAKEAFREARAAGFDNTNIDLMFGIPGQTMDAWMKTLEEAADLKPEHISFYSLQIEEGTPYYEQFHAGNLEELPDILDREMYHQAIWFLKNAGYKHYEISNAGIPGFECRHNLKYWTLQEYLGIGPSAASYIDGTRFTQSQNHEVEDYIVNTDFDNMSEFVFTGLRLTRGINYGEFKSRFGIDFEEAFRDQMLELSGFFASRDLEKLVDNEGRPLALRLTEKGIDISNQIMAIFV